MTPNRKLCGQWSVPPPSHPALWIPGLSRRCGKQRERPWRCVRCFPCCYRSGVAACDDPEVRETVQAAFGTLWNIVSEISGLDPARVKVFIAIGMLLNDVAALDVSNVDAEWARACLTPTPIEFFR